MTAGLRFAALVLPVVLLWSTGTDSQKLVEISEETPIFVCESDQIIPEIPLNATNVILAGDGRLYSPCAAASHSAAHREIREATLIGRARFSGDFVLRFRGAQAMARNATRPLYFPTTSGSTEPPLRSL